MLYCAYGSNCEFGQMNYRCPNSKRIGVGSIDGWKLVFKYHADIVKDEEAENLPVVLWDIADEDWEWLDIYEGFPLYYDKKKINVNFNGGVVEAVVYVMTRHIRNKIELPSHDYFEVIKNGYEENEMNTEYLFDAMQYTIVNEGKTM